MTVASPDATRALAAAYILQRGNAASPADLRLARPTLLPNLRAQIVSSRSPEKAAAVLHALSDLAETDRSLLPTSELKVLVTTAAARADRIASNGPSAVVPLLSAVHRAQRHWPRQTREPLTHMARLLCDTKPSAEAEPGDSLVAYHWKLTLAKVGGCRVSTSERAVASTAENRAAKAARHADQNQPSISDALLTLEMLPSSSSSASGTRTARESAWKDIAERVDASGDYFSGMSAPLSELVAAARRSQIDERPLRLSRSNVSALRAVAALAGAVTDTPEPAGLLDSLATTTTLRWLDSAPTRANQRPETTQRPGVNQWAASVVADIAAGSPAAAKKLQELSTARPTHGHRSALTAGEAADMVTLTSVAMLDAYRAGIGCSRQADAASAAGGPAAQAIAQGKVASSPTTLVWSALLTARDLHCNHGKSDVSVGPLTARLTQLRMQQLRTHESPVVSNWALAELACSGPRRLHGAHAPTARDAGIGPVAAQPSSALYAWARLQQIRKTGCSGGLFHPVRGLKDETDD
ncbi:hypothetical protein QOM21_00685 [Streptomyces sp. Pv4-95]|uniref:hypothetical protein n=1 Tax=Streptomyces sp. Pv4-95 TaxID=3049543 RepID=UPI00389289FF